VLEHRLQTFVETAFCRLIHLKELVIGLPLNLDKVRHLGDLTDFAEEFAESFATGERECHVRPLPVVLAVTG